MITRERSADGRGPDGLIITPVFDALQQRLIGKYLESGDGQLAKDLLRTLRNVHRGQGYPVPSTITSKPTPVSAEDRLWSEQFPGAMPMFYELLGVIDKTPLSPQAQDFFENNVIARQIAINLLNNAKVITRNPQGTPV